MNGINSASIGLLFTSSVVFAGSQLEINQKGEYLEWDYQNPVTENDFAFHFSRNVRNGLDVDVRNYYGDEPGYWVFRFSLPQNQEISTGYYEAVENPDPSIDNLFSINNANSYNSCGNNGWFEVHEISYDTAGNITAIDLEFEKACLYGPENYAGRIQYQLPVGALTVGVVSTEITCHNMTTGERIKLSTTASSVDCRTVGLALNQGDTIRMGIRSVAQ